MWYRVKKNGCLNGSPGKEGPPELVSHDSNLAGGGRRGGAGGDDLALSQGTGDGDGVGDAGSTVRRRRRRGDASGVGGATVDGVVEAVLLVELRRGDGVVRLHGDLAAGAVVDGVDGAVVADSEGDVEGLDPEDEVAGNVTFKGLQGQVALLSSLAKERVDLATKGSDGPVSVAVVGSLGIPVVGVLLLHQGHDLGLEGLHDLGCARRSTSNVSAEKVGRTVDFDKHCVCGYVFSIEGDGGGMVCRL